MHCPNCAGTTLQPVLTQKQIEINHCPSCNGGWFDQGEMEFFFESVAGFEDMVARGHAAARPTSKVSPETGGPMVEFEIVGGIHIDYCPQSGGHWLDGGELARLQDVAEGEIQVAKPRGFIEKLLGLNR